MTTRYTDDEWAAIITSVEQRVLSRLRHSTPLPIPNIESPDFARTIDHTLLKIEATKSQIDALCGEARVAGFASVCVRPTHAAQAVANTKGSPVKVDVVIGFPEGNHDLAIKMAETKHAVKSGAQELDIVLNRTHLQPPQTHRTSPTRPTTSQPPSEPPRPPHYNEIYNELASLRSLAPHPIALKLILETSQLSTHEIIAASTIAAAANFDFVKTSTGFLGQGATVENVRLLRACCDVLSANRSPTSSSSHSPVENTSPTSEIHSRRFDHYRAPPPAAMQVKASGGIRTLEDAIAMLEAGASRLGTSGGVWIVKEARQAVEWKRDNTVIDQLGRPGDHIGGSGQGVQDRDSGYGGGNRSRSGSGHNEGMVRDSRRRKGSGARRSPVDSMVGFIRGSSDGGSGGVPMASGSAGGGAGGGSGYDENRPASTYSGIYARRASEDRPVLGTRLFTDF